MNGLLPEQLYRWPLDGPPIAPSAVLWLEKPVQGISNLAAMPPLAPVSLLMKPTQQQAQAIPAMMENTVGIDTIVSPNYMVFIAPGLETRIYLNENGDLYAKQISGPNAGKSCNLTESKWL